MSSSHNSDARSLQNRDVPIPNPDNRSTRRRPAQHRQSPQPPSTEEIQIEYPESIDDTHSSEPMPQSPSRVAQQPLEDDTINIDGESMLSGTETNLYDDQAAPSTSPSPPEDYSEEIVYSLKLPMRAEEVNIDGGYRAYSKAMETIVDRVKNRLIADRIEIKYASDNDVAPSGQ